MKSPIQSLSFLPLLLFPSLHLSVVSGASPVFPSLLPTVFADWWRLSFSDTVRTCRSVCICAFVCVWVCECVCLGMDPFVSVLACVMGKNVTVKRWWWGVQGLQGGPACQSLSGVHKIHCPLTNFSVIYSTCKSTVVTIRLSTVLLLWLYTQAFALSLL